MKLKYEASAAIKIARDICDQLSPACERIEIAGSLRRRKSVVCDIEILYVPKTKPLFDLLCEVEREIPIPDLFIADFVAMKILERRKNVKGNEAFGEHIKLTRHIASGIPIDFFACVPKAWFNYLVCRTGGTESNIRIASRAKANGYKWKPYSPGFIDLNVPDAPPIAMNSEEAVFRFVGLAYQEPWRRP